jgi:hypothetical protein
VKLKEDNPMKGRDMPNKSLIAMSNGVGYVNYLIRKPMKNLFWVLDKL